MVANTRPVPMMSIARNREPRPDEKILEALQSYHIVHLDLDTEYNSKLTWCLEHCQNKFRDFKDNQGRAWYFKEEQDAVLFAMKWS